jgi:glycosyltransferase involved in cell wall biosynthesis
MKSGLGIRQGFLKRDIKIYMTDPVVSVKMITYNHSAYITRAIEGVLMQQTGFSFELVIGDDCSTDGTTGIITSYANRYPKIIKHIIRPANLGVKKNTQNLNFYLKGKYVALCEGDDYWTDPLKLQKQVSFMEANPDYSLCFHPATVIREDNIKTDLFSGLEEREYSPCEILNKWLIPTGSVIFLRSYYEKFIYHPDYLFTDVALFLKLAEFGKIWCINDNMSVYQRHRGGITQHGYSINEKLAHYRALNSQLNFKYNSEIRRIISDIYLDEAKLKFSDRSALFLPFTARAIINCPGYTMHRLFRRFRRN